MDHKAVLHNRWPVLPAFHSRGTKLLILGKLCGALKGNLVLREIRLNDPVLLQYFISTERNTDANLFMQKLILGHVCDYTEDFARVATPLESEVCT